MVHALRESWRVLNVEGILIDLRPLSTRFPIDAVTESNEFRLGEGDATATIDDSRAADLATLDQVRAGWLTPLQRVEFDIHYYWHTTDEMADLLRSGRVPKAVTPSYAAIDVALRATTERAGTPARLRATRRMTLGSYAKRRPAAVV